MDNRKNSLAAAERHLRAVEAQHQSEIAATLNDAQRNAGTDPGSAELPVYDGSYNGGTIPDGGSSYIPNIPNGPDLRRASEDMSDD